MVRVVSAANLGFGDFGGGLADREVDGIVWDEDPDYVPVTRRSSRRSTPKKPVEQVLGGRDVMQSGADRVVIK